MRHTGLARVVHGRGHGRPHEVDRFDDDRVEVRIDRITEWWQEEPGAAVPHLMHVPHHLREPLSIQDSGDGLALDLRQHEPVTIVVVPDIRMVQPGKRSCLESAAFVLAIPRHDRVQPIGIGRRSHQDDDVLEHLSISRVGYEAVRELHRELAGSDLRGVDVVVDEHDGRHRANQRILECRAQASRIGKQRSLLTNDLEVALMPRCRDGRHEQRLAERGTSDRVEPHSLRSACECGEIGADLRPVRQHRVGTDLEAQHRSGIGDGDVLRDQRAGRGGECE